MSESLERSHAASEEENTETHFDPIKHRHEWLERLLAEMEKIEPLMPSIGSRGRARTYNHTVNSRVLYH